MRLVSTIIPAYNCADYLGAAICSALDQRHVRVEVVVVNDGSTDGTDAVVQPYLERIIYIKQENRGLSAARNAGFRASRGEFVCFLDADDLLLPDKFARQLAVFEREPDLGVVISGYVDVDAGGETPLQVVRKPWHRDALARLLNHEAFPPHAALIRRGVLEASALFPENIVTAESQEDWQLWLDLALDGVQFSSVPEPTCKYRRRPGSISADALTHLDGARRVVRWLREDARARPYAAEVERLAAIVELERVARAWCLGKVKVASEALLLSVTMSPNYWRQPDTLLKLYLRMQTPSEEANWVERPELHVFERRLLDEMLPALVNDKLVLRNLRAAAYLALADLAYAQHNRQVRLHALHGAVSSSASACFSIESLPRMLRAVVGPSLGGRMAGLIKSFPVRGQV